MSENVKTLTFVAIGAVVLVAAYFIDRPTQALVVQDLVGKTINADFEVDEPKRLRIVKFDRQTADTRDFEVAAVDGVWSIPSKQGYPADATRQMAAAANALIDRKILMVAGQTPESHEQFGVVDPLSAKLDASSTGVGTRVVMTDAEDKQLVDMIIGKKVKGSDTQRYVRKSNQDVVYVVELDPNSLSTEFDDWIEDDLLKLSPFDIRRVFINDYSADLELGITPDGRLQRRVNWDRRGEATLTYDNDEAKWNLAELKKFDPQSEQLVEDQAADSEEVNQDALGKLRTALDDLLIVDVAKKPEGLSADLKAGEGFLNNREAAQDLMEKGFAPVPLKPGGEPEILSSEGEVVCSLRDGVEYVLRFGKLQLQTDSAADGAATDAEGDAADDANKVGDPSKAGDASKSADASKTVEAAKDAKAEGGDEKNLRRYLFVMARFNDQIVDKPKLKELPELPAGAEAADKPEGDDADAAADGDAPAAENAEGTGEETDAANPEGDEVAAEGADAAKSEDAQKTAELEKLVGVRKAIEEENKRLQDEYDETIKKGQERVAELNGRFGDWYYVISNDVFRQIHLGRGEVIKKKDKPAAAGAAGAAPGGVSGLPSLPLGGAAPVEEGEPATESNDVFEPAATPPATDAASGEAAATENPPANAAAEEPEPPAEPAPAESSEPAPQ